MVDTMRRFLAAAMIAVAVIGLMPLVPIVFGYVTANVTEDSAGTYVPRASAAPAVRFIQCVQVPSQLELVSNNKNSGVSYYVKCTNNWVSSVAVTVNVAQQNNTGLVWSSTTYSTPTNITPGNYYCFPVGRSTGKGFLTDNNNTGAYTVVYHAAASATDLTAAVEFTGVLNFSATPPTQTITCP